MNKRQTDIWQRILTAEDKLSAGVKNIQFWNGQAINSEDELNAAMVSWWDSIWPDRKSDLIHIANEGTGSLKRGLRNKRIGVRAGVPDFIVCKNRAFVGWIETKFGHNTLEPTQREFRDECLKHNVPWALVKSMTDFLDVLQKWGLYNPKTDKPHLFDVEKYKALQRIGNGEVLDINKIFKR